MLARSELARTEELGLFDIAWKSVSGAENGDDLGEEGTTGPKMPFVDDGRLMGENGTTDEDTTKEAGP